MVVATTMMMNMACDKSVAMAPRCVDGDDGLHEERGEKRKRRERVIEREREEHEDETRHKAAQVYYSVV